MTSLPVGTSEWTTRIGTKSPYDLAFWASTFIAPGTPDNYLEEGPETNGLSLLIWSAGQVGVTLPVEYVKVQQLLTNNEVPIVDALKIRGAVLINSNGIAITMGLTDAITVINGRYFQVKTEAATWDNAGYLPGLVY